MLDARAALTRKMAAIISERRVASSDRIAFGQGKIIAGH
ncbi:hypothetical protein SAMCFNEI73_pC1203 (plasmid) [Sinorhizobium americanum]|uniref:Uncharacterized protein n=1 Tax=Sinorhizobium americanum TaxID=194963 RepID=A0A1L3LXW3_9HYPH|nr:hypothetical protein SAMCFNEI73_pC1203 [Sinorhizobium americanum]